MSSDIAIKVENLSKCYQIYDTPRDRLKQFVLPRLQRMAGRQPKQYYKEFWALRDVSFEVKKGETVGIIGRNGSGKSTLLQMICGTLAPTIGSITTHGRIAALLELGSGFNPEFTGRENVYLNASVLGLSRDEIDQKFDDIAAFADIGEFIEQPVKTYSSGMYVRLAFAVIAHADANLLVIDEALAVGDAYFTQKCMRFLRKFKENNTLIFVSHDSSAITNLCDNAIWLDKGISKGHGTAKKISELYLASLYENTSEQNIKNNQPTPNKAPLPKLTTDPRLDLINRSSLRNDLKIFSFTPGISAEFGIRKAQITTVELLDHKNEKINFVIGGESVTLLIGIEILSDLDYPIVGFSVKDKLGQVLFGDNTYITYRDDPLFIHPNVHLVARFSFRIPILPAGDYSIAVAIASGTQDEHIQHHWIHDAIILKSISSSVSTGLVGIPMNEISLTTIKG